LKELETYKECVADCYEEIYSDENYADDLGKEI